MACEEMSMPWREMGMGFGREVSRECKRSKGMQPVPVQRSRIERDVGGGEDWDSREARWRV
jgi:hypothetical protein